MSFQVLKRDEVDTKKWDATIKKTPYAAPYSLSWYLDAATDKSWKALVQDDYLKIMPLPYKNRLLWKQVYQPPLSQQLGIFGEHVLKNDIVDFLSQIPKEFAPVSIPMNATLKAVDIPGWIYEKRDNYILHLGKPYEELRNNYSHGLKSRIKKNTPKVRIESFDRVSELDTHFNKLIGSKIGTKKKHLERANAILTAAYQKNHAFMIQVIGPDNSWASQLYFLRMPNRIIKLRAVANKKGRKYCANHIAIDHVIRTFSEQDIIFDFEGSSIPGVASFFKSFGPKLKPYYLYEKKDWAKTAYTTIKKIRDQFQ